MKKRTPLHYAAATQDGGHYVKILTKAGADTNAMDTEGHTPHYYRFNNVINLESMKRNDDGNEDVVNSENFAVVPNIDSVLSSDSASIISSSTISTSTREQDETDEYKFDHDLLNDSLSPTSSNAIYLARAVAPVLLQRPTDPIIFIANWLIQYREKNPVL
ncbi:unnamed protein product [Onchocerca flexuosa]|uniref:ANK_REP_REGION domain-containing protein n=1 Tax=Onchocerca flexuosa TaxID=387005 RepID=A0A183HDL4_9BILA|nr:unnamed protein product [Onchocerca flexuosa]